MYKIKELEKMVKEACEKKMIMSCIRKLVVFYICT